MRGFEALKSIKKACQMPMKVLFFSSEVLKRGIDVEEMICFESWFACGVMADIFVISLHDGFLLLAGTDSCWHWPFCDTKIFTPGTNAYYLCPCLALSVLLVDLMLLPVHQSKWCWNTAALYKQKVAAAAPSSLICQCILGYWNLHCLSSSGKADTL